MGRPSAKLIGIFCLMFAIALSRSPSFSLSETWNDCKQPSCKAFFAIYPCSNNSSCECGVTANESTCSVQPKNITNKTGVQFDRNQQCCFCQTNTTFCCRDCQTSSVHISPTSSVRLPTRSSTAKGITSLPNTAILSATFILDCDKYLANQKQVSESFRHAIGNLTKTNIDVTNITCSTGARPYCGVDLTGFETQGKAINREQCQSMTIKATMNSNPSTVSQQLHILQISTQLGNLSVRLWDDTVIKVSFLTTRHNSSSVLYQLRATKHPPTTTPRKIPPIETNLWPLIYSAIGVGSLILLCIVWQCAKQSYLLSKKKYTDINSNRINSRKKKVEEAMENKEATNKGQTQFDMTHNHIQAVDNDALTRRYDWTTPGYLPSMLDPAYPPTERQRSLPRLILDDEESDYDKRSIGKASVVNIDEETDEDLKEILESEDEEDMSRTNTRQSYVSMKKSLSIPNAPQQSNASKNSHGPRNSSTKTSRIVTSSSGKPGKKNMHSEKDGAKSPTFGNLKSNRITPIDNHRKSSVSSLKPKTTNDSRC